MNSTGDAELLIAARSALLDALEALVEQRDALVLVGAQAIYLHTGAAPVALAETTKDSDIAVDPRALSDSPLLDEAMQKANFHRDLVNPQPGAWLTSDGIPVDLMVPEALAGAAGRRAVEIPPHDRRSARRTLGLEAAVVEHSPLLIEALDPSDGRTAVVNVAAPAALLVAKLHKLGERQDTPDRLIDKDAHDVYRILIATETASLSKTLGALRVDELAGAVTEQAIAYLDALFASGPGALGSTMAGRAEDLVGDPAVVSAATAALSQDLISALGAKP